MVNISAGIMNEKMASNESFGEKMIIIMYRRVCVWVCEEEVNAKSFTLKLCMKVESFVQDMII